MCIGFGGCRWNASGYTTAILSNIPEASGVMATEDTRLIMIAGKPINEPLVQYDAMKTREEIQKG